MKDIKVTRKLKEELSKHFQDGGTLQSIPDPLSRLPDSVIQEAYNYERTRKARKAHPVVSTISLFNESGVVKTFAVR